MSDAAKRLHDAQAERERIAKALHREDASLEALVQARKRIIAIVQRLAKDSESEAQKRLLSALRLDAKMFARRIESARAEREKNRIALDRLKALIERLRRRLTRGNVAMFDSIDVAQIPRDAKAAAGYTSGFWPTWNEIKSGPWPHKLSIAVTASHDAECLDCEPGDATPEEAPAWVKRQKARGVKRPVVYASLSNMPAVLAALARAGISRSEVRAWTAHYTGTSHICTPACGFGFQATADATQFTDSALGRNLDESLCDGSFFN